MILVSIRLIFGAIKRVVIAIFSIIYKMLKVFNLQLTALVLLVGLVLFITGVFERSAAAVVAFGFALVISVIVAVYFTVRKLLGLSGGKKRKGVEIVSQDTCDTKKSKKSVERMQEQAMSNKQANYSEVAQTDNDMERQVTYPVFYSVRQNRDYIMAEYADKYELYLKDKDGLKKIRTDYKSGE